MTVEFFAYYRYPEYAGCKSISWQQEASNVIELCHQIADRYGDPFRSEILSPDGTAVGERTIIMVNGRRADFIGGSNAPLRSGDKVQIFPVVAGG